MGLGTIKQIMIRIKGAELESQIAVFHLGKVTPKTKELNAVFAATVRSKLSTVNKDPALIGVYHRGMNFDAIYSELKKYVQPDDV